MVDGAEIMSDEIAIRKLNMSFLFQEYPLYFPLKTVMEIVPNLVVVHEIGNVFRMT